MKQQNRIKFLLMLPLLTLPFLTFAFWALGGGSGKQQAELNSGINLELPEANLKDEDAINKLGYYEKATTDSNRINSFQKNDPYYNVPTVDTMIDHSMDQILPPGNFKSTRANKRYTDPNEAKVYQKLDQLNNAMKKNERVIEEDDHRVKLQIPPVKSADVDRLERMMKSMSNGDGEDPEMKQLNGMIDKILDIQHPERVKEKIKETSIKHKDQVFPVTVTTDENISLLEPIPFDKPRVNPAYTDTIKVDSTRPAIAAERPRQNGFYSFNDHPETETHNSVAAVIHETQTIVTGEPVMLRLMDDIYINGVFIPKDNFIFGIASLSGERLKISVQNIRYQHSIFPVGLSVYDIDGLEGIYIPGAISRDVAKHSAEQALQHLTAGSTDPSIGAQALGLGIEAGKNLLSKKAKLVRVTVKAGYKVLLKDNNNK